MERGRKGMGCEGLSQSVAWRKTDSAVRAIVTLKRLLGSGKEKKKD